MWPEQRLRRHLIARKPNISLHSMEEILKHGYPHKIIYRFDPTTGVDFVDLPW